MHDWDWARAWSYTDEVLRLAHVQAWLWPAREALEISAEGLDEVAAELCSEGPTHPLWDDFAEIALYTYHQTWQEFDLSRWSVPGPPNPVAPDLEVVLYVRQAENPVIVTDPGLVVARPFLMRFTGARWLVAHAGSAHLPVPGWPPQFPSSSGGH
jgi:hypothetical protein